MDILYKFLEENVELYSNFLDLEYEKYDAVVKDDINALDNVVAQEQAFYLKMKGLDQRREKILKDLGFSDKTLREIIDTSCDGEKQRLIGIYDKLNTLINEFKKINSLCKTLIEIRLHRVDKAIKQLEEKGNTCPNGSLLLSKKI